MISIVVPVYNTQQYLRRCVDSILAQTYTEFELILVDDGSPDNCGAICDEYAEKDGRVHVIHQQNGGLSAARNAGIDWAFANSDSEWLSFVDSDDWVHPQYCEFLLNAAQQSGSSISMCYAARSNGTGIIDDCEKELSFELKSAEAAYTSDTSDILAFAWGRLYKKELWSNIRFPEGRYYEDVAVTYKLLLPQKQIAVLNDRLYYYFINENGIVLGKWSPTKMDLLWSMEQQLSDPLIRSHERIYRIIQNRYAAILASELRKMPAYDHIPKPDKEKYTRIIRGKLRYALRSFGNDELRFKNAKWCYEQAYPGLMKLYWIINAQFNKLKRGY